MALLVIEARAPGTADGVPADLAATTRRLELPLTAMHPGASDPALAAWYAVELPDDRATSGVLEALRALPSVTAAYLKPAEALP